MTKPIFRNTLNQAEIKYFVFANVLDILAHKGAICMFFNSQDITMTFEDIKAELKKLPEYQTCGEIDDKTLNVLISELSWMNMIARVSDRVVNSDISITREGLKAYQSQTFYSVYASLIEAKESRRLSKWAIGIAIVSLICAMVTTLIK